MIVTAAKLQNACLWITKYYTLLCPFGENSLNLALPWPPAFLQGIRGGWDYYAKYLVGLKVGVHAVNPLSQPLWAWQSEWGGSPGMLLGPGCSSGSRRKKALYVGISPSWKFIACFYSPETNPIWFCKKERDCLQRARGISNVTSQTRKNSNYP